VGTTQEAHMQNDSDLANEFKALLKWHFEEGAGRITATAGEAAQKLVRLLSLQLFFRGKR
jgi:hypothetical protein